MKTKILFLLSAALVVFAVYSQVGSNLFSEGEKAGSKLTWHSFDEGIALSAKENKKILMDVYTDWCVWCKKMDKEVYTTENVMTALNKNFVLIKLDAESQIKINYDGKQFTEQELAQAFGITGYPTTVFLQPDAHPITILPGFVESERFSTILTYIGDDHYKNVSYQDYVLKSGKSQ